MLIIVGLGNPGLAYRNTYHNMGFNTVDKLAARLGVKIDKKKCSAKVGEAFVKGEKIVLAKPQTYMNLSGQAVKELLGAYHAEHSEMVVVYDDIDLDRGTLRFRTKGSAGTHNGMRSIVEHAGEDIPRLRVGIGKPQVEMPLYDYVLSRPKGEAFEQLDKATDEAAEILEKYIATRTVPTQTTTIS
ncbi:MAG: aminoacyl-tRNA hydrolase [Clostridia bacterium]|nr:aminoacyl-tRNA hydrolase [Clostridia bacterium]